MTPPTPSSSRRLVALCIGGVVVQTAAISQLPIAGANADLSPLLVMAVGPAVRLARRRLLRLRRRPVRRRRLDPDARRQLARAARVGYGAGRLREARDPEGTLVPLAVGAAATLIFGSASRSCSSCSASTRP
jgi:hypothetical protein